MIYHGLVNAIRPSREVIEAIECPVLNGYPPLYEYGIFHYGQERADRYYNGLVERCEELAENPRLWQAVDHIRPGYRRSVYGRRSIYYRIDPDEIMIVRILGRQDPQQLQ